MYFCPARRWLNLCTLLCARAARCWPCRLQRMWSVAFAGPGLGHHIGKNRLHIQADHVPWKQGTTSAEVMNKLKLLPKMCRAKSQPCDTCVLRQVFTSVCCHHDSMYVRVYTRCCFKLALPIQATPSYEALKRCLKYALFGHELDPNHRTYYRTRGFRCCLKVFWGPISKDLGGYVNEN